MFKLIRYILGQLIVFFSFVFSPKQVTRPSAEQANVDSETKKLALYQFHLCPFCVRVRRAIHRLNLTIELRDAMNDERHRNDLLQGGGKIKTPCLRIENESGVKWLYESKDIISYLDDRFENNNAK
jgi:glutaredoxin